MIYKNKKGQSVIEYFIIFTVILAVVLSTDVVGRMRTVFSRYFDSAAQRMR